MATPTVAEIATAVWTTKPKTVGQETGGALHELDLRSASTEARLGPIEDDLAAVKASALATAEKVDEMLALLKSTPPVVPPEQA